MTLNLNDALAQLRENLGEKYVKVDLDRPFTERTVPKREYTVDVVSVNDDTKSLDRVVEGPGSPLYTPKTDALFSYFTENGVSVTVKPNIVESITESEFIARVDKDENKLYKLKSSKPLGSVLTYKFLDRRTYMIMSFENTNLFSQFKSETTGKDDRIRFAFPIDSALLFRGIYTFLDPEADNKQVKKAHIENEDNEKSIPITFNWTKGNMNRMMAIQELNGFFPFALAKFLLKDKEELTTDDYTDFLKMMFVHRMINDVQQDGEALYGTIKKDLGLKLSFLVIQED